MDETWTVDSGRGLRSHIGLHGFLSGQMVVDQGIEPAGTPESSRRTLVEPFPESWRVVLIYEDVYQGDFGENEQSIFDACSKKQNPHRERMLELIERQILPSVRIEDFQGSCQAIGLYGELAGGVFAQAVGDVYRSPRIRYWVDRFRLMGFAGTGQSSWGPVVFVLTQDQQQAQWLVEKIVPDLLEGGWASITKVAGPARIENLP
jgi:beta-ribofuranosylaminobenzene 5'-phosphate synthase